MKKILLVLMIFAIGWMSSTAFSLFNSESNGVVLSPVSGNTVQEVVRQDSLEQQFDSLISALAQPTQEDREKISPHDWVRMDQIKVYDNQVILNIKNPEWAMYLDTNSMDPVIDATANTIQVIPQREEDVHVGDIVAYESRYKEGIITHRVIEVGYDSDGWYAYLKGDNNQNRDPGKVRFSQIKRIVVAIIY